MAGCRKYQNEALGYIKFNFFFTTELLLTSKGGLCPLDILYTEFFTVRCIIEFYIFHSMPCYSFITMLPSNAHTSLELQ
jgi:hypothetical protein